MIDNRELVTRPTWRATLNSTLCNFENKHRKPGINRGPSGAILIAPVCQGRQSNARNYNEKWML